MRVLQAALRSRSRQTSVIPVMVPEFWRIRLPKILNGVAPRWRRSRAGSQRYARRSGLGSFDLCNSLRLPARRVTSKRWRA
jgi:hypothetical protein